VVIIVEENEIEKILTDFNKAMENFSIELMKVLTPAINKLTESMRNIAKGNEIIDIKDAELIEWDENGKT